MGIYISASEKGFFNTQIHEPHQIPEDAQEITQELYEQLLAGMPEGKIIDFSAYPPVLVEPEKVSLTEAQLTALIASTRYEHETAGITINGMQIDTSDRSKTLINGSALKALRNPDYVLRWKTPEGFVDLPAAQVLVIADAVSDFVQACFDREDQLLAELAAGTYTESMLTEGWPE